MPHEATCPGRRHAPGEDMPRERKCPGRGHSLEDVNNNRQHPGESSTSWGVAYLLGYRQSPGGLSRIFRFVSFTRLSILSFCLSTRRFAPNRRGCWRGAGWLVTEIHSLEISQPKKFNSSSPLTLLNTNTFLSSTRLTSPHPPQLALLPYIRSPNPK